MFKGAIVMLALTGCAACQRPGTAADQDEAAGPAEPALNQPAGSVRPGEPGGLPDDRTPISEGRIDPQSAQGAAQILQSYAALLEQRRFAEARKLWSDGGAASGTSDRQFAASFDKYSEVHAEIGRPGSMEGAAGSTYVEIPVRFYGKRKSGGDFSSSGVVTLRRVNDVPGSTAEQRNWHISRIEVQPPL